jgi:all-trans-retinol dehydrogenase (NAD+)
MSSLLLDSASAFFWSVPPPVLGGVLTVALVCYLTSPRAAVQLFLVLCKLPLHWLRSFVAYLLPFLFSRNLSNDVVVITGAASGIGKLMACRFANSGCTVVLLDKNEAALEEARVEVQAAGKEWAQNLAKAFVAIAPASMQAESSPLLNPTGKQVRAYAVDLASREATYSTMRTVQKEAGPVTILVNNAGVVTGKALLHSPDEMIDLTMRVNVMAHFWTTKAVLPQMLRENCGHIVTVSSIAALCGLPGMSDYCASKAASFAFDESLRLELRKIKKGTGKAGVKTTVVCPYCISTGMFEGAEKSMAKFPRLFPVLKPEYVADQVLRAVKNEDQVVLLPRATKILLFARALLPTAVFDQVAEIMSLLDAMDNFAPQRRAQATRAAAAQKAPDEQPAKAPEQKKDD